MPRHKIEFTEKGDEATAFSISPRIKTLDELLTAAEVDLNVWEVRTWTANSWEQAAIDRDTGETRITTLHQVKANLVPNKAAHSLDLINDLRSDIRKLSRGTPRGLASKRPPLDGHMVEISVFDLHMGKYAWKEETGQHYDMEISERLFKGAVFDLLAKAQKQAPIDRILLPIGNDFFNADNERGETTAGTRQDMHGSHRQHFKRVRVMLRDVIDRLSEVAPVHVPIVPGNHDHMTMYFLGDALEDHYHHNGLVRVYNGPKVRKYVRYGSNLIGYTHGNEEKLATLPLIMATEAKAAWSKTSWREWHIGHFHKKKEVSFLPIDEYNGVRVRVIPSLSATDIWHYKKGYTGSIRTAEAYLWHKTQGVVGQFNSLAAVSSG